MSDKLAGLKPEKVFHYFEEIANIPHGSGNTKRISDYCVDFAKQRGLEAIQDELGNVIIVKEAVPGREEDDGIIIQGHLDMVIEKKSDVTRDLMKEGLELKVEGDLLFAEGTTLGADDGIAVAYALALLDEEGVSHPRLEVILTVDEEIGMLGAAHIDLSMIKGKYLLNIDSEEEGILLSGCAGGMTSLCKLPITYTKANGLRIKLKVSGLRGGHSGMEIDKERGNADILLGRALYQLRQKLEFSLESLEGGFKDNAIPREASAILIIDEKNLPVIAGKLDDLDAAFKKEYKVSDNKVELSLKETEHGQFDVISKEDTDKIIFFLMNCPNGVLHHDQTDSFLIETSLNLGILRLVNNEINFSFSVRSSVKERKEMVGDRLRSLIAYLGGGYEIHGSYPEWEYNRDSVLLSTMAEVYQELFGRQSEIKTIHAGLECGYLIQKRPELDIVSFGPNVYDIHTTEERMSISSVQRMYDYLIEILKRL